MMSQGVTMLTIGSGVRCALEQMFSYRKESS